MALYIGNADSKPQYVAGLFYGDANNKPVRVVAGWIGDENNKPRLFYSPNLEYTVDAYGADWWGGEFYINMLNVSGGTGRYRYKFTLTVEGKDPLVYESPEPTRATSCSYTFTLPNAGTYATWEATVMDAANAHCMGSQSGRFDVVQKPFVMGCEAAQISIYTNGVWKATIYSNVLKNYDINKVKASVKEVDDDDRTVECVVDYYEENYASPEVWFYGDTPSTYRLEYLTLTTSRGVSATVGSGATISVYVKSKTVTNVVDFYGSPPQFYFNANEDTPSMDYADAVYGVVKVNSKWYSFSNTLVYQNGDLWDGQHIGTLYFLASDFYGEIIPSMDVYYN